MNRVRTATVNALLKQDSLPKFGELAAQDLAAIWDLGRDGNRNHLRTWRAARKTLREAIEHKCDVYYPGWQDRSKRESWLKAVRFRDQVLKDITDMASLIANAE